MHSLKLIRFFLPVVFACNIFSFLHAQPESKPYSDVSIASPTAASLGKYADVPVDYFTGVPSISIPIYTVKEGPLSLPINLSYHAGGLKVWEPAGWVGTGWALNAGGVITRSVMGGPDESGTNNGSTETGGYFSENGYYSYFLYNNADLSNTADWQAFAQGFKDGQPDLFFFNFNGYSGKFIFNDDRTPVLFPESDLKISCNFSAGQSISDFTITTPDGVKYFFGRTAASGDTDPIEITGSATPTAGYSSAKVISSWYLNKIQSADGLFSINLSYAPESYGYFTIATSEVNSTASGNKYGNGSLTGYGLVKNVIQGVRLKQITFSNGGQVNFIATTSRDDLSDNTQSALTSSSSPEKINSLTNVGTEAKALDEIDITDGAYCQNYKFSYSYFVDNSTGLNGDFATTGYNLSSDRKRLKLDQVAQSSCDNTIINPPYKFTYNTSTTPPRRICFGVDHWGFYNGKTNNQGLIPPYYIDDAITGGADRDAYGSYLQTSILQNITYPTGGTTAFVYEPNDITATFPTYNSVGLCNFSIHRFGQSALSSYQNFTVVGTSSLPLDIKNYSNYSVIFKIAPQGGGAATYTITVPAYYQPTDNPSNNSDPATHFHEYTEMIPTSYQSQTHPAGYAPPGAETGTLYYDPNNNYSVTPLSDGSSVNLSQMQSGSVTQTSTVGGLRVKTITTNDGVTSQNIVTNYSYATSGNSNGYLFSRPTYIQNIRNDIVENVGYYSYTDNKYHPYSLSSNGCLESTGGGAGLHFISAGTLRPMATAQGSHIGYSQVTVSQAGNGSTVYKYVTPPFYTQNGIPLYYNRVSTTICDLTTPNYPTAPLPFDYQKGNLTDEAYYSESNSLLKETVYQDYYTNSAISTHGFIAMSVESGGNVQYVGTKYVLTSAKKIHSITTDHEYPNGYTNGGTTTVTDVYYSSPNHHQPTLQQITEPNADILKTVYTSAFDYVPSTVSAIADGYPKYLSDSTACRTQYSSDLNYTNLEICMVTARKTYITYRQNNFYNTSPLNTYQSKHNTAKSGADAELKPILEMQDEYKNPVIETSEYKNGNLTSASFNRFDYGTTGTPVAPLTYSTFPYPNKLQTIFPSSLATTFAPAVISASGTSVTKDSRYTDEQIYVFNNGNPATKTGKDGIQTSYIWDYMNNEPVAVAANAAASDIAYTSFETASTGYWTLTGGTINTTDAITGSSSYTVGTSISKSGLNTSRSYVVSYWSKGYPLTISGATSITGLTKNGWTYYQHTLAAGVSSVTLTGSGTVIDELRLYPADAQMTTYTYRPLLGMSSSCSANNLLSYYEYDALGRLDRIRDIDKNILKQYCYTFNGQSAPCNVPLCSSSSTYTNYKTIAYRITLTNSNSVISSYLIDAAPNTSTPFTGGQSSIPPGTYAVSINAVSSPAPVANFSVAGIVQSGTSFNASNLPLSCGSTIVITIQ